MEKTYWWRIGVLIVSFGIILTALFGPCELRFGKCVGGNSIPVTRSLFHVALALLAVAPALFVVKDRIFSSWLRFAIVWLVVSGLFVFSAPEYSSGWLVSGPEKESVSIWMASLFVVVSLVKILLDSRKKA